MKPAHVFLAGSGIALASVIPAARSERLKAWTAPQWGFVQPSPIAEKTVEKTDDKNGALPKPASLIVPDAKGLSRSLIFDQPTDRVSFRPFPRAIITAKTSPANYRAPMAAAPTIETAAAPLPLPAIQPATVASTQPTSVEVSSTEPVARMPQDPVFREALARLATFIEPPRASMAPVAEPTAFFATTTDPLSALAFKASDAALSATDLLAGQAVMGPVGPLGTFMLSQGAGGSTVARAAPASSPALAPVTPTDPTPVAPAPRNAETPTPTPPNPELASTTRSLKTTESPITLHNAKAPRPERDAAIVFVTEEESLMNGETKAVANARVTWIGDQSGLSRVTDTKGMVRSPIAATRSMRFVVRAHGYLPAVGYAVEGLVTPVVLVSEKRLAPVLKSLGVVPDPAKTLVFGKVLDKNGLPVGGATVDASIDTPFRVFYSLGSFGVFHKGATQTGPQGDFFVSGMSPGIQYLMPTQTKGAKSELKEWPAAIVDLANLGPAVTVTVQESPAKAVKTHVVDAFSMERPSGSGIQATVGGQRGVYIPDSQGTLEIPDLHRRASSDLVEIRAQGYLTTWVTGTPGAFPDLVALFTQRQIDTLLSDALQEVQFSKGIVFGNLRTEKFPKPVVVRVHDSTGKASSTGRVLYFNEQNLAKPQLTRTDTTVQNFSVVNLEPGEWQIVVLDAISQQPVSSQVVRVDNNTVSQIQF